MTFEAREPGNNPTWRPFDLKSPDQTQELVDSIPEFLRDSIHTNPQNDRFPLDQHFFTVNKIRPNEGVIGSRLAVSIQREKGLIAYLSVTDIAATGEGDFANREHFVLIPKSATLSEKQEVVYLDVVGTQEGKDAIVRVDSNGNMKGELL